MFIKIQLIERKEKICSEIIEIKNWRVNIKILKKNFLIIIKDLKKS